MGEVATAWIFVTALGSHRLSACHLQRLSKIVVGNLQDDYG